VFFDLSLRPRPKSRPLPEIRRWVDRIASEGFVVVHAFKTHEWCAQAGEEVSSIMADDQRTTRYAEDMRVFGIENLSRCAAEFGHDLKLLELSSQNSRSMEELIFCMGNRVCYTEDSRYGSGGEWHRDGFRRELKAILYLTDVGPGDGPFALVRRSNRLGRIVCDVAKLAWNVVRGQVSGLAATRLKDAGERLGAETLIGAAGTLILFDTSTIHCGLEPQPNSRVRIALTNYYVNSASLPSTVEYYRRHVTLN
jgi:hypothetical protein